MKSLSVVGICVGLSAFSLLIPCRSAAADVITLEWDSSTAPIEGYKLYVGTQSGTYTEIFTVGAATTFTFTNAVAGQRYCFALTAYSSPALESLYSNEVCGYSDVPPVLTNPGNQSSDVGQPTTLQLAATDPDGRAVTYSATGLPPGLWLGESTGFISGAGTTSGSYEVQVTASDGVLTSSQSFTWELGTATAPPPPASSPDGGRLSWTGASWTNVWGVPTVP